MNATFDRSGNNFLSFSSDRFPLMLAVFRNLSRTSSSLFSSSASSVRSSARRHRFLTSRQTSAHVHPSTLLRLSHSAPCSGLMELKEVLQVLEQLAPLSLAESWDNVGLLVEPSKPRAIKTILLTNDLTDSVMEEAEAVSCDLIVSYHPPLFRPIKRLVQKHWKQRLAIRAIEAGIAVFSPHTSLDSVKGGVNDWLVGGLGKQLCHVFINWCISYNTLTFSVCFSIFPHLCFCLRQWSGVCAESGPRWRLSQSQTGVCG